MKHRQPNGDSSPHFDPRMIIEEARLQAPAFAWLPDALDRCGPGKWEGPAYIRYVSSAGANQPGSMWQFAANVVIHHHHVGTIVIDVLKGERIGGIEFLEGDALRRNLRQLSAVKSGATVLTLA